MANKLRVKFTIALLMLTMLACTIQVPAPRGARIPVIRPDYASQVFIFHNTDPEPRNFLHFLADGPKMRVGPVEKPRKYER